MSCFCRILNLLVRRQLLHRLEKDNYQRYLLANCKLIARKVLMICASFRSLFSIFSSFTVSQDLLEKATQLKFRLHFQSTNQKGWLTQKTFDQSSLMEKDSSTSRDHHVRQSLINLSTTSKTNPKEKPRLPIIRDKNATNYLGTRRGTTALTSNSTAKPTLRRGLNSRKKFQQIL